MAKQTENGKIGVKIDKILKIIPFFLLLNIKCLKNKRVIFFGNGKGIEMEDVET